MGTAFKRRTPLSLATALGIETAPRESDGLRIGAASGSGAGAFDADADTEGRHEKYMSRLQREM